MVCRPGPRPRPLKRYLADRKLCAPAAATAARASKPRRTTNEHEPLQVERVGRSLRHGRAREFYEGKLGLSAVRAPADGRRIYASGGYASLHVYPSPPRAGESTATLATWYVDDVERVVDELASNGVTFEHCEEVTTDEKGISPRAGGGKVAWFKDPAGGAARELPPPVPGAQDGTLSC